MHRSKIGCLLIDQGLIDLPKHPVIEGFDKTIIFEPLNHVIKSLTDSFDCEQVPNLVVLRNGVIKLSGYNLSRSFPDTPVTLTLLHACTKEKTLQLVTSSKSAGRTLKGVQLTPEQFGLSKAPIYTSIKYYTEFFKEKSIGVIKKEEK